jgi:flagellar hook-associated protein 3 FlgL
MPTRVADIGANSLFVQDILRNERRVFDAQRQVSSGQKSDSFKGLAKDISSLLGAKTMRARAEQMMHANQEVAKRMSIYDATLGDLRNIALELRDNLLAAVNTNSGLVLREQFEGLYERMVGLLTTKDAGKFIYSGTRTDVNPLTTAARTVAGVAGLTVDVSKTSGTPTQVTQNNGTKQSTTIDENVSMEFGILAEDAGADLIERFRRLLRFDNGTENFSFATSGPFSANLTADQRDFLIGELDDINTVIQSIERVHAENGFRQESLESVNTRHSDDVTFLSLFISDVEEVDTAEAIARLNQDQAALEASLAVTATLTRLSLLNFL